MAHYKSSTTKGGRKYLHDASASSKLAHYTQLNSRGYGQKEVAGMSRDSDKHFVALPAGWRKSHNGKWYFENRKNRSDNTDEKYEAWNSTMTPQRKKQTFKHVWVNQTAVLGEDGKPRYVKYVVRYGDYLNNKGNGEKTVKELIAEREARRLAYVNRIRKASAKKATAKKVTTKKAPATKRVSAPKTPVAKKTKAQSKAATLAKYKPALLTDVPVTFNRGRKPSVKKSATKNAKLPSFGVKPTVKKATAKKVTTKKSTARKTSKKN